jgi:hypothetical protein
MSNTLIRRGLAILLGAGVALAATPVVAGAQERQDKEREMQKQEKHRMEATQKREHLMKAPPGEEFEKVSELVEMPEFVPGLGVLYVQPEKMPIGPFLAYDRAGELMGTVYMVPLSKLERQENFTDLKATGAEVKNVDFRFNPGHPGVAEPHYHVVLWHVPQNEAAKLTMSR